MGAGMARQNRLQPTYGLRSCRGLVSKKLFNGAFHPCSIPRKEEVAFPEKLLSIIPRRRDKGNPAGQGLKYTNCWDAVHGRRVLLARNVDGETCCGVSGWSFAVREIASVCHSGVFQRGKPLFRVAHPINAKLAAAKSRRRPEQEIADLLG